MGHSQGAATANFLAGVSAGRSQGAANAFRRKAFRLMRPRVMLVSRFSESHVGRVSVVVC